MRIILAKPQVLKTLDQPKVRANGGNRLSALVDPIRIDMAYIGSQAQILYF